MNNPFLSEIDVVKIDGEEFLLNNGEMNIDIEYDEVSPGIIGEKYVTVEFTSDSEIFRTHE